MKGEIIAILILLATTKICLGQLIAGDSGSVNLNKDIYRVGEGNATVTVNEGKGGYQAGRGSGFKRITANFYGTGVHPITISNEPSEILDDSGVTVEFIPQYVSEEALSVTSFCTVIGPKSLSDSFSYTNFLESGKIGRISIVIGPENWPGKLPFLFTLVTSDPKIACFRYNGKFSIFTKITKAGRSDFNLYKPSGNILAPNEVSRSCEISSPLSTHKVTATVLNAPPKVDLGENFVHTTMLLTRTGHVTDIEGATLLSKPPISIGGKLSSSICIHLVPPLGIIFVSKPRLETISPITPDTFSYTIKYSSTFGYEYYGKSTLTVDAYDPVNQHGRDSIEIKKLLEYTY